MDDCLAALAFHSEPRLRRGTPPFGGRSGPPAGWRGSSAARESRDGEMNRGAEAPLRANKASKVVTRGEGTEVACIGEQSDETLTKAL